MEQGEARKNGGGPAVQVQPARVLLVGLVAAQIVASFFVYGSNLELYEKVQVLTAAGYLTVPNPATAATLLDWTSALAGGLFFSFSAGAGLSFLAMIAAVCWNLVSRRLLPWRAWVWGVWVFLVSLATAWLTARFSWALWAAGVAALLAGIDWLLYRVSRRRFFLAAPLLGLLVGLALLSERLFFAALILGVVPPVFVLTLWRRPRKQESSPAKAALAWAAPLLLTSLIWGLAVTRAGHNPFTDVRDYLLWSNPAGERVVDFYYRYTLYPVEAFSSLKQKTLRTAGLAGVEDPDLAGRLRRTLIQHDFLPLDDAPFPMDLNLRLKEGEVSLFRYGRLLGQPDVSDFLGEPGFHLGRFLLEADDSLYFRRFTRISLFAAMPLALYVLVFGGVSAIWSRFVRPDRAPLFAAGFCLGLSLLFLSPVLYGQSIKGDDPAGDLTSTSWWRQVAALRRMDAQSLDIEAYPYRPLLESPRPVVRYWLAVALGNGRSEATLKELMFLVSDPAPNVACQALYALGRRAAAQTVPVIEETVRESDHWYVQNYGYATLRTLGWTQELN